MRVTLTHSIALYAGCRETGKDRGSENSTQEVPANQRAKVCLIPAAEGAGGWTVETQWDGGS